VIAVNLQKAFIRHDHVMMTKTSSWLCERSIAAAAASAAALFFGL